MGIEVETELIHRMTLRCEEIEELVREHFIKQLKIEKVQFDKIELKGQIGVDPDRSYDYDRDYTLTLEATHKPKAPAKKKAASKKGAASGGK
jgi:uncharacterized membrane protein YcaP (DUF421 family)